MEFEFKQVQTDDASLRNYADLLSRVFPATSKYTYDFLKWQYVQNPYGKVIGFDAFYDNKLAAHYVTIPVLYTKNGTHYKGLLSLNTATDPAYQGKGLFTKLAQRTYQLGAETNYNFVIGVANQNSTHGFINKLGFKLIAPLNAYIYLFDYKQALPASSVFQSVLNEDAMAWRTANPSTGYLYKNNCVYSATDKGLIKACLSKIKKWPSVSNNLPAFKMEIGIGNTPKTIFKIKLPDKLKPSPLNLIFKPLGNFNVDIPGHEICFELIDFDAY